MSKEKKLFKISGKYLETMYPDYDYFDLPYTPLEESEAMSSERKAHEHMRQALNALKESQSSRENALAITNLEQAMMWNEKDRIIKKKGIGGHANDSAD